MRSISLEIKRPIKGIPDEVVMYVEGIMSQYEHADNIRIMRAHGNSTLYHIARKNGCCRFVDWQKVNHKGVEYWYGFNYGH